jgi:carbamoyl-phosphate synthase small subunit
VVLADGTVFWGKGLGAVGCAVGEVVFNTSMTGYQESLTDLSYAGQIITFTFPHIGNVGTNPEDIESLTPAVRGAILRADITEPSNWRSVKGLSDWLAAHGISGIAGIDTRALTRRIRGLGAPNGCIVHAPDGAFDLAALTRKAAEWPGLEGMDLAKEVSCRQQFSWDETLWRRGIGYGRQAAPDLHVVAVDFGAKRNILRCLANAGCRVTVVPADSGYEEIARHKPDGVFLSNGPGDPAATGIYAEKMIQGVIKAGLPLFGICLGHQMLARALGGQTSKMVIGHRGANHPVKDLASGKVEITSQNHGFAVVEASLPAGVTVTHRSLFDGSVEGLAVEGQPIFSVQYHPEASPGPQDSHYLFDKFIAMMKRS